MKKIKVFQLAYLLNSSICTENEADLEIERAPLKNEFPLHLMSSCDSIEVVTDVIAQGSLFVSGKSILLSY